MKSYAPIIALVAAVFAQSAMAEGGGDIRDNAMKDATDHVMAQYRADHAKDAQATAPATASQAKNTSGQG